MHARELFGEVCKPPTDEVGQLPRSFSSEARVAFLDKNGVIQIGRCFGMSIYDAWERDPAFISWALASAEFLNLTHSEQIALDFLLAIPTPVPPLPPEALAPPPIPPLPPEAFATPEMERLAEEIASTPRPEEPIEEWAQRLAADMVKADLIDPLDAPEAPQKPTPSAFEAMMAAVPAPPPLRPTFAWTDEQNEALARVANWRLRGSAFDYDDNNLSFFSLTGPAGTGKTTVLRDVVNQMYGVALTAMTGKAALRLAEQTGRGASTLHRILYFPPSPGRAAEFTQLRDPEGISNLIVDEASMMTPSVYRDLQKWASRGVRVLLVGDPYQLPPVITGKELQQHGEDYSVFTYVKGAALKTVMRSAGGILRAATYVRERGDIFRKDDDNYGFVSTKTPLDHAVTEYVNDPDDHLVITWRNSTRMAANKEIRKRLGYGGPLPDPGEPVLIKKNGNGFLNGEIVRCGEFEDGPMIADLPTLWMTTLDGLKLLVTVNGGGKDGGEFFDGGQPWVKNWSAYTRELEKLSLPEPAPVTWGYCLTAHSAQGSEARRVTVFLEKGDDRSGYFRKPTTLPSGEKASFSSRWIYTATTRGRERAMMIVGR